MTKQEIKNKISQKLERELAHYDHSWNDTNIIEVANLFSGLVVIEVARTSLGNDRFKWNVSLYSGNACSLDNKGILAEFGGMTAEDAVMSEDSLEQEVVVETAAEWAYNALNNNTNIIG